MTTRAELADMLAAYDEVTAAYAAVSSRPSSTVHEIEVRHVVRDAAPGGAMSDPRVPEPERVFEPSAVRPGRLAVSPVWYVTGRDGRHWRFARRRDAIAFIQRGRVCGAHTQISCACGGSVRNWRPEAP